MYSKFILFKIIFAFLISKTPNKINKASFITKSLSVWIDSKTIFIKPDFTNISQNWLSSPPEIFDTLQKISLFKLWLFGYALRSFLKYIIVSSIKIGSKKDFGA